MLDIFFINSQKYVLYSDKMIGFVSVRNKDGLVREQHGDLWDSRLVSRWIQPAANVRILLPLCAAALTLTLT